MSQQQKSYLLPIVMMFALFAMISFVTGLPAHSELSYRVNLELPIWKLHSDLLRTSLHMHLWVFLQFLLQ